MTIPAPNSISPRVCRSKTGALNTACHQRRARELRRQAIQQWIDALARLVMRCWRAVAQCVRSWAAQRELAALDERTLHDLGLTHGDLPAIADGSFYIDETRRQRSIDKTPHDTSTSTKRDKQ